MNSMKQGIVVSKMFTEQRKKKKKDGFYELIIVKWVLQVWDEGKTKKYFSFV